MAHTGESMGVDDAHNSLPGPDGWQDLLKDYAMRNLSPKVNLGHFGGDSASPPNDWTSGMAAVMAMPHGDRVFGDLGYWTRLMGDVVTADEYNAAKKRLSEVLGKPIGDKETVADRLMFGSDWHMMSIEKHWGRYGSELFKAVQEIAPEAVDKIFGGNAIKCFGPSIDKRSRQFEIAYRG